MYESWMHAFKRLKGLNSKHALNPLQQWQEDSTMTLKQTGQFIRTDDSFAKKYRNYMMNKKKHCKMISLENNVYLFANIHMWKKEGLL